MKAFPAKEIIFNPLTENDMTRYHHGMDLRDYFASKAMLGILSAIDYENSTGDIADEEIAERAYSIADVMMEARKK
jgi:hypothetical protein